MAQHTKSLLTTLLLAALITLPINAVADSQLERFEEISERANEVMMELMVEQYASMGADPEVIRNAIPDGEWDDEYRTAGQCMLDRYADSIGRSGVNDMLEAMDAMFQSLEDGTRTLESMEELGNMNFAEGISTEQQIAITRDCGLIELSTRRMRESGFMEAVMAESAKMADPDES